MGASIQTVTGLYELFAQIVADKHGNNIDKVYDILMSYGIDRQTLGFWVWDIENNIERYSPKFKETLGVSDEFFPDTPDSWRKQISTDNLGDALHSYYLHVDTYGDHKYILNVTYRYGEDRTANKWVRLTCHGRGVSWKNNAPAVGNKKNEPLLMIGVHLPVIEEF